LIKESQQWARRCEEVWFHIDYHIDIAERIARSRETLELYDEALLAFREVAKWAAEGKKKLAKGKKVVTEELRKTKLQESSDRLRKD